MNAQLHTPGPWHSALVSERTWNVGVYDQDGDQVALVKVASAVHGQRRDADARLMAAAPDLLAALKFCVEYDGGECLGDHPAQLDAARAAIAKATGGTP